MPWGCCQRTSTVWLARGDGDAELALLGARRAVLAVDRDLLDLGLRRDAQDEGLLAAAAGGGGEADALQAAAGGGFERHAVDREGLALDALRVREADGDRLARPGPVLGGEDALGEARDGREARGGAGPDRAAPEAPHLGPRTALGRAQDDLRGLLERRLPAGLGLVAAEAHRHLASLDDEVGAGGRLAGEKRHAQRDRRAHGGHAAHARLDGPRDAEARVRVTSSHGA